MLHDKLVQLGEIGDVDLALAHALFALAQVARAVATPSVTMKKSAPRMPAEAKSPASPRAANVVSVCCTSTASVEIAANISASRGRTTNDRAPIGSAGATRGRWSCRRSRTSASRSE